MSAPEELAALQKCILDLHGAQAEHLESVPIVETFNGQTVWDGAVEVFALPAHPAGKAYAWRHESDSGGWRYVAVLHKPPIDSPRKAVQAAVAHEFRSRQK